MKPLFLSLFEECHLFGAANLPSSCFDVGDQNHLELDVLVVQESRENSLLVFSLVVFVIRSLIVAVEST